MKPEDMPEWMKRDGWYIPKPEKKLSGGEKMCLKLYGALPPRKTVPLEPKQ